MAVPEVYKGELVASISDIDIDGIWRMRSSLQALRSIAEDIDGPNGERVELMLDTSADLLRLMNSLETTSKAADFNRLARLLNTGGEAINAAEEILTKEDASFAEILVNGLTVSLGMLGNTAYVSSALQGSEMAVRNQATQLYDTLWEFMRIHREGIGADEVEDVRKQLDTVFDLLKDNDTAVDARAQALVLLYRTLIIAGVTDLVQRVQWE